MLQTLCPKYRRKFISPESYQQRGIILSDTTLLHFEEQLLPPSLIPRFVIGDKLGEGSTSETFAFLDSNGLAPFSLVVQYHPIASPETQHLVVVSCLINQLYSLCPHTILYLGYYLAPATIEEEWSEASPRSESYSPDEEEFTVTLSEDCYALLYERVTPLLGSYHEVTSDPELSKYLVAQLFFIVELLRSYGFNHGDIALSNLAWEKEPTWQGRKLLNYTYYAYIIRDITYYLPSCPLLRLFDYNLTSYQDIYTSLIPPVTCLDDFTVVLDLIKTFLPPADYLAIEATLNQDNITAMTWSVVFGSAVPSPGDKVIVLGHLPV